MKRTAMSESGRVRPDRQQAARRRNRRKWVVSCRSTAPQLQSPTECPRARLSMSFGGLALAARRTRRLPQRRSAGTIERVSSLAEAEDERGGATTYPSTPPSPRDRHARSRRSWTNEQPLLCSRSARTAGSVSSDWRALSSSSTMARFSACAGVSAPAIGASNSRRTVSPGKDFDKAWDNFIHGARHARHVVARVETKPHQAALAADEHAVVGQLALARPLTSMWVRIEPHIAGVASMPAPGELCPLSRRCLPSPESASPVPATGCIAVAVPGRDGAPASEAAPAVRAPLFTCGGCICRSRYHHL